MLLGLLPGVLVAAELRKGDVIVLTMRGVNAANGEVNGEYTVDDAGRIRLPLLDAPTLAEGMTPAGFARSAEAAYRSAGIYTNPAIEVVAKKAVQAEGAVLTVGGKVKRNGPVAFRDGMTVLQAIDAAGGRDDFGGRNVILIREGKQYCLDFHQLEHKNVRVLANDSIQVEAKPAFIDRWKGSDEEVKELMGE